MSSIVYSPSTYSRLRAAATDAMEAVRFPLWLCAIQAVMAYEWLVFGANKLLNSGFSASVPGMIQHGSQGDPYAWYVAVLRGLVLPHYAQWGALVAWGETAVGATLLLSALLWATQPASRMTSCLAGMACLALVAAVVLNVNSYLLAGYGLPWIDPSHALMPLIGLALLGANLSALRKRSRLPKWL